MKANELRELAYFAGIDSVPPITKKFPPAAEPEWTINTLDFGRLVKIHARWGRRINWIVMGMPYRNKKSIIAYVKQALRQSYFKRNLKRAA